MFSKRSGRSSSASKTEDSVKISSEAKGRSEPSAEQQAAPSNPGGLSTEQMQQLTATLAGLALGGYQRARAEAKKKAEQSAQTGNEQKDNGVSMSGEASVGVSYGVEGELYNDGTVAVNAGAEVSAGAGAQGGVEIDENGFQAQGSAEIGITAEATLETSVQVSDNVSVENSTTAYANVGAGAEGSAGFHHGDGTSSGNLQGGAHAGAEVGVETEQTVNVGESGAQGGLSTSVGPSFGASGGGNFEASRDSVTIGFNVDADVVLGIGVSGEVTISANDVEAAGEKLKEGGEKFVKGAANTEEVLKSGGEEIVNRLNPWKWGS